METQNEFIIIFSVIGIVFLAYMAYFYYLNNTKLFKDDKFTMKTMLIGMLIVAFLVRVMLAYTMPGYISDSNCFRSWANLAYTGGLENFYSGEFFADYPPFYVYVLYFMGFIEKALNVSAEYVNVLIRMPSMLLDIVCAVFVYNIASKKFKNYLPLFLAALVALNPATIMNSAVWGQVDILLTVMLVLTIYMMIKEKILFAAIFFMIALLLKPQAVLIAPVILFYIIKSIIDSKNKVKSIVTLSISIGVMILMFFIIPLPFGVNKEPLWLVHRYMETMGQYPYASLNAFNLYAMIGLNFLPDTQTLLGIPINILGFIFIALICAYSLWLFIKNSSKSMIFALCAFIIMGIFALSHGMHERYIFPVPIFLIFAYIFNKDKRLILCTILTSAVLFINQGVSILYYEQFINTALIASLSAVSMIVFVYVGYVITRLALKPAIYIEKKEKPQKILKENSLKYELDNFKKNRYIHKKDWIIMLAIAGIYSIFAFANLGTVNVPKSGVTLDKQVDIEFSEPINVTEMRYYADYGSGVFDVEYSLDGVNYNKSMFADDKQEIDHQESQLYEWQRFPVNMSAKYFRINPKSDEISLLEWAFFDENSKLISPVKTSENALFDEQNIVPEEVTYMSDFYFDEIYHVRTAYENIHEIRPYEITHPPLGKLILSLGIQMFGMNGFGWRFMGTLTGVLMLFVIYIFAKLLLKKTKYAAFASILFALDFMHFTQTRIGTIDSYSILFILLMFLFMYMYSKTNFNVQKFSKTLLPLFLCGLFFGIGAATKWLCIYSGVGLLILFILIMYRRYKEYVFAKTDVGYESIVNNYKKNLTKTLLWCVLFFLIIPATIYLLSYIPYTQVTQGDAYTFKDILGNQSYMLNYHAYLDPEQIHPFASKWYTWPLTIRPILYYHEVYADGTISNITSMGNPLIWWTGVIAVISLAVLSFKKKIKGFGLVLVGIALANQFIPWTLITRELFIYHYFASVPFIIIAVVYWLKYLDKFKYGKIFGIAFICACGILFVIFYPIMSGVRVNLDYLNSIRWIQSWPFY